ncbi:MAG: hypothetical protein KAT68_08590 [Bacteroidales bacterium]|nr:hypothetical protein [Bacteroidales bacterium]
MEFSKETQANSFYVILSGLLRFDEFKIDEKGLWNDFTIWRNRINKGDYKFTFNYLNHSYYDGYLNNIFPEIRYSEEKLGVFHKDILNHLTSKKYLLDKKSILIDLGNDNSIESKIDHIDLYLFPHDICIFSIKLYIDNPDYLTLGYISDFINKIRNLSSQIYFDNSTLSLQEFIEKEVIYNLNPDKDWTIFNPQLKSYIIIDLKEKLAEDELDYLLYDIGNISILGSAKGEGVFAPAKPYFDEQIEKNKISIFKNWSALALYDTFTRISLNFPDNFKSWDYDYFNLYIHCLYLKYFMYLTNTELSEVTVVTKKTEKIRDEFIEFINDYYHSHISYKFLPDLMQDKLMYSLEISSEIDRMETKIQRINEHFQEKREKTFNIALITITLLSVVSVIYSLSEWIVNLGCPRNWMYPFTSEIIALSIIGVIYYIFSKRK